nr:hypothetical protein [Candidatus Sigynarchaeum springense]
MPALLMQDINALVLNVAVFVVVGKGSRATSSAPPGACFKMRALVRA